MRTNKNSVLSQVSFFIGLAFVCICPRFFPSFHPLYFSPYLALLVNRFPLFPSLLRAILCGVIIDLVSAHPFFGLTPLAYCISLTLVYTQKFHFFEDKLSTLPVLSALFSSVFTLVEVCLFALFGGKVTLSFRWLVTDLFGMALFDAAFALFFFALPFHLTKPLSKALMRRER